jgi:hypothetical protein
VATADVMALDAFLANVRRRVQMRDVSRAALAGAALLFAGAIVASIASTGSLAGLVVSILVACAGLAAWLLMRAAAWQEPVLLPLVESRQPEFHNLLVTSRELVQHPLRARPAIRHKIFRDAARVAEHTTLDTIVPPRDTTRAAAAAAATALIALTLWYGASLWATRAGATRTAKATIERRPGTGPSSAAATGVRAITATVTPPSYTGRPAVTLKDPARIEAMAGSRLRLQIDVASGKTQVAFNERAQAVTAASAATPAAAAVTIAGAAASGPSSASGASSASDASGASDATGAGQFQTELLLTETGVLSITAVPEAPRLIAVTVTPDQPPAVDILSPAKDLLFGDDTARVAIGVRAQDDLGLRSLALRYTKVSGSGEQYEFHEGDLPLAVTHTDARQWQGQIERTLKQLEMAEGDLLVYYAVAHDGRPGDAGRAVSDSFVIEIGKGGVAIAGGFAIPPEEERFAISLGALIQKTEKLHAKREAMPFAEFESATQMLAVEQRMVRNEFLFSMGSHGHVEDEVEEAESSDEVQAGRLENRGQAELTAATRLMTLSERHLIATDTTEALKAMRNAQAAVQKALSRHRYFLRTMPVRGEIDLTRRLTGDLSEAGSARWPANDQTPDARRTRVRAILADLASLASALESASASTPNTPHTPSKVNTANTANTAKTPNASASSTPPASSSSPASSSLWSSAAAAAARVLALDPASASLRDASAALTQASQALAKGNAANATTARDSLALVRKAAAAVLPLARPAASAEAQSSKPTPTASEPALRGAVIDALRTPGGSR